MSKVRINDLARELEVKSKAILDTLPLVGVTEKKTHSSSLEEHEAEKVRVYLRSSAESSSSAGKSSSRGSRGEEEIKTKIDLSNISRPGDVLKAITQRKEAVAPAAPLRPATPPAVHAPAERPATVVPPLTKPVVTPAASRGCATRHSSCSCAGRCTSDGIGASGRAACAPSDTTASGTCSGRRDSASGFSERSASGSHWHASGCASICIRAPGAANDRSANRAASGVQSSAADGSAAGAAGSADRRRFASGTGTSRAWAANFSAASADGRWSSRCAASAAASG